MRVVVDSSGWVNLRQHVFIPDHPNHTLRFGPLEATLQDLFDKGFHLACQGRVACRYLKLGLYRGAERYTLCKFGFDKLQQAESLQCLARHKHPLIQHTAAGSLADMLLEEHPRLHNHKFTGKIGNMSVAQFLLTEGKIQ